jgi:hypothetical protein
VKQHLNDVKRRQLRQGQDLGMQLMPQGNCVTNQSPDMSGNGTQGSQEPVFLHGHGVDDSSGHAMPAPANTMGPWMSNAVSQPYDPPVWPSQPTHVYVDQGISSAAAAAGSSLAPSQSFGQDALGFTVPNYLFDINLFNNQVSSMPTIPQPTSMCNLDLSPRGYAVRLNTKIPQPTYTW